MRSQGNSDWGWLISDEVLQVSSGHVGVHELEETIGVRLLSEGHGNWGWLVGNKVLKVASGHVGIHKLEEAVGIRLGLIELHEGLGDWSISVLNKVNESALGNILTVKLTNLDLSSVVLLGPVGGLIINGVVSIIVWETLVEDVLERLASGELVVGEGGHRLWSSLDHHGEGNVIVVRDVLGLISGSLQDGVEGVVANNLSEGLEGNRLNDILVVSWVDLQGDGLNLIDWHVNGLSELIEWVGFGGDEGRLGWGSWLNWGSWLSSHGWRSSLHILLLVVVLVVLL